jgi:hypothetical protein
VEGYFSICLHVDAIVVLIIPLSSSYHYYYMPHACIMSVGDHRVYCALISYLLRPGIIQALLGAIHTCSESRQTTIGVQILCNKIGPDLSLLFLTDTCISPPLSPHSISPIENGPENQSDQRLRLTVLSEL